MRKDPVFLDCQAHGEGPVKVTWLKNGAKLSENKRIQVLSNGSLYIREVEGRRGEHSDEGFYQCLAVNKYGAILSQKAHLTLSTGFVHFEGQCHIYETGALSSHLPEFSSSNTELKAAAFRKRKQTFRETGRPTL
ncbi:hypothetical protein ACRRTK_003442 [Alexandromys fortis]